jgi:hypothetical protein
MRFEGKRCMRNRGALLTKRAAVAGPEAAMGRSLGEAAYV